MYKKKQNHSLCNERVIFLKKIIIILLALISIYLVYNEVKADTIIIPDTSIRLRVIPNSNSVSDQSIKKLVKNYLEENTYNLLKDTTTIEEAREIINKNLDIIESDITKIFNDNNYNQTFNLNYGLNYFPKKELKGITYNEGYYESLVVYIGEAKGDNWWCVLFPPLCMMEMEEKEEIEYKSWVKEVISKIF